MEGLSARLKELEKSIRSTYGTSCSSLRAPESNLGQECQLEGLQAFESQEAQIQKLKRQSESIQQLRRQFQEAEQSLSESKIQLDNALAQKEKLTPYKQKYEEALLLSERLEQEVAREKQQRMAQEDKVKRFQKEKHKDENRELKSLLGQKQAERQQAEIDLRCLKEQLCRHQQLTEQLRLEHETAKTELKKAALSAKTNAEQLKQRIKQREREVFCLKESNANKEAELKQRVLACDNEKKGLAELQKEVAKIERSLLQSGNQEKCVQNQIARQQAVQERDLEEAKFRQDKLSKETKQQKLRVGQLERELNEEVQKGNRLKEKLEEEELNLSRQAMEGDDSEQRVAEAEEEIRRLQDQVRAFQQELQCRAGKEARQAELSRQICGLREQLRLRCEEETDKLQSQIQNFEKSYSRIMRSQ